MSRTGERGGEKKRYRNTVGSPKTGADNSMVPDDQDETSCARLRPEIRKKNDVLQIFGLLKAE